MSLWIVLGICAAVFVMFVVVAGTYNLFDVGAAPGTDDPPRTPLPETWTAADLDRVTFTPVLRGYRMDEVDAVIASLRDRLTELEGTSAADPSEPAEEEPPATAEAERQPTPIATELPETAAVADERPQPTPATGAERPTGSSRSRSDLPRTFPES